MEEILYREMFELESSHWWFVARREIVLAHINQFLPSKKGNQILDVGCGTGAFLEYLEHFGVVHGLDASSTAIQFCHQRGKHRVQKGNLPDSIPFNEESFNLITTLDVLEHIDDDFLSIKKIYRLLKRKGVFLCTVPAFPFLWSGHDNIHHHFRRYFMKGLKEKLMGAGFKIIKISYYNIFLFPIIALIRLARKTNPKLQYASDAQMPPFILNSCLKHLLVSEKYLLKYINLPFGVSMIAVCEKP